jgi:hypothetical protein
MQCIHAVSVHPLVRRGECVESASVSAAVGEPLHRGCAAGTSEPPTKALAPLESGDQCRVLIADLLGIEHMCGARTAFCRSCRGLSRLLQRGLGSRRGEGGHRDLDRIAPLGSRSDCRMIVPDLLDMILGHGHLVCRHF